MSARPLSSNVDPLTARDDAANPVPAAVMEFVYQNAAGGAIPPPL